MAQLHFRILGCGSSGGVPRLGGNWGLCDPSNPKNYRRRCSLLVEKHSDGGITRVLVDTSPDLRSQLLDAGVGTLDGVVYTHSHADHVHGLDDLRMIVFNMREKLKVWADGPTSERLMADFSYVFLTPEGSSYPPILELNALQETTLINGDGGEIEIKPFFIIGAPYLLCFNAPLYPKFFNNKFLHSISLNLFLLDISFVKRFCFFSSAKLSSIVHIPIFL